MKKFQVDQPVCYSNRVTFLLNSEDTVKLFISVIHQMHLMAKFEYASLTLLTEIPVYEISSTTRKTVIKAESTDRTKIHLLYKQRWRECADFPETGFSSRASGHLTAETAEPFSTYLGKSLV